MQSLTEQEVREYRTLCEAYFTRDADIAEVYRRGNLTVEGACERYANRSRARRLGLPVPSVVAEPMPIGYNAKPNTRDPDHWASFVADQRKGHGPAGRNLWERLSQHLSIIEHEPITKAELAAREQAGPTTGPATGPRPRLEAMTEWLDEHQAQRQLARETVTYLLTDDMEPTTGPEPRGQAQPYLTRNAH